MLAVESSGLQNLKFYPHGHFLNTGVYTSHVLGSLQNLGYDSLLQNLSTGEHYTTSKKYEGMDHYNKVQQEYVDCKEQNQCKHKDLMCQL